MEKKQLSNKEIISDVLEINTKERAIAKTRYLMFSKYCYWILCRHSDNELIFYIKDLVKYAKISSASSSNFFDSLVNLGYMKKEHVGNNVFFKLILNNESPKLKELLPYINKTLKLNGYSDKK